MKNEIKRKGRKKNISKEKSLPSSLREREKGDEK